VNSFIKAVAQVFNGLRWARGRNGEVTGHGEGSVLDLPGLCFSSGSLSYQGYEWFILPMVILRRLRDGRRPAAFLPPGSCACRRRLRVEDWPSDEMWPGLRSPGYAP